MKCFVIFFASENVRAETVEGGPARRQALLLRPGILAQLVHGRQSFLTRRPSVIISTGDYTKEGYANAYEPEGTNRERHDRRNEVQAGGAALDAEDDEGRHEIGRASCRERV